MDIRRRILSLLSIIFAGRLPGMGPRDRPGRRAALRLLSVLALPGAWLQQATSARAAGKPPLMLANTYREGVPLADFWGEREIRRYPRLLGWPQIVDARW